MKKIFLHIILMVITATVYCQNIYVVTKTTDPDPFTHKFDNVDSLCDPEMYGTLQWAINKVNNNTGENRIEFNIPGVGPHEIILNYYLPQIKNATIIDGSTQNGYSYGNPQIIINAQHKHNSIFDVYSTNITIKGLKLTSFAQNGILLHECSNSLITENIISNYSITPSKTPYIGLRMNGCQNVELYGNNIEVALDETVDPVTKSYGIYASKSFNCTIGGIDTNLANTIKNCRNYGVFIEGTQQTKISGNIIFGCEKAIYFYFSNDNIQPPEISEYTNGILSGTALPNSTIEIFGSTGAENANEYLASVVADENGDWGIDVSSEFKYFISTQTSSLNNTSMLSISFINPRTTQLLAMFQNADSVDLDNFLYAKKINGAIKYQFNVMQVDSGVNQIITKDVNFISLLELENNEAYYDKEYKIKVRAIFENDTANWGEECTILTINEQKYKYGIVHLRILPEYNNLITPFSGIENSAPIFIEGFSELNLLLQVNTVEKTFPRVLNKLPDLFNIYTIYFNEAFSTDSLIHWANQTGYFEYASNYPIYKLFEGVNDQYYNNPPSPTECAFCENNLGQWSLQQLNAEEAWDLIDNENVIKIAIVDDAVRYDHIDLHDNIYINTNEIPDDILSLLLSDYDINDNNLVDANEFVKYCKDISSVDINNLHDVMNNQSALSTIFNNIDDDQNGYIDDIIGWDASHNDNDPYPGIIPEQGEVTFAHGTHVAGISSAVTNNNEGIASLSLNRTRIIPVKIYIDSNSGSSLNNPYEGVEYAIAAGADIINMSWGGELTGNSGNYINNPLYSIINSAHNDLGITFIASMGNDGNETIYLPAFFPEVVAIGATTSNQKIADFSTIGAHMDFFAPGAEILSSYPAGTNTYCCKDGTSMSCPLASALWALLKSMNPNATFDEIYNCIASTCIIPEDWYIDCNQAPGNMPWSNNVSKHGIINPKEAVSYFKQLLPVAMFEYLESTFCPDPDVAFHFYSTSSGGPITSDMGVLWSSLQEGVQFSSPNDLNTTISFPSENTYTIVFTIYDIITNEIISQHQKDIIVSFPSVEINNSDNFRSCKGFEVSVFLTFSGTPPFKFTYTYDGVYHHEIDNVQTHDYTLFMSGSEELNTGSYELKILKVGDNFCINAEETFATSFQIIDCDLCSKKHNSIITWQKGRLLFNSDFNGEYTPQAPTVISESSCAITNNNQEPLLLMKGDYLYNLQISSNYLISSSNFGISSKEGSLILPHDTGNPDLYYALVVADNSGSQFTESLRFHIIDVKDPNEMLLVNTETVSNLDEEVMVACEISDDYGYWLLTNTRNSTPLPTNSNILNLYKLQNNELKFVGTINVQYYTTGSHMCFSPNMNLLAIKEDMFITSIYKFNRELNCPIENRLNLHRTIDHTNITFSPEYYEFSPNSKLLYTTGYASLLQFEIDDYGNNEPSHTINEHLQNMRLGLDDKLYIGKHIFGNENPNIISRINAPNEVGTLCFYDDNYITTLALGTPILSRKTAEIPFKFDIVEEETSGCQVNLVIDNLTGYEPFTYLWNDNSTNNYLNNVGLGEYSVTITDTHGCTLDQTYNVTSLNYPICSIDLTNNVCFGTTNTGSVDFSITDGTAPYVVELLVAGTVIETQYFDATGSYSFENIEVNNYSIRVTDNIGCQNEVFFTIGLANEMELTFSLISMPCENSSNGSASVDVQFGESPYTYIWSNGETTQTAISLTAGNHTVTVVDNNNCSIIGNVNMPAHPTPTLTLSANPATIYSGETSTLTAEISGGTPTYSYAWTPNLPNQATNNVTPIITTTYTLTVTDTHGCTSSDATTVVVENMGLIATYNNPVCQYTQLQLFAQPDGLNYLWTGPNGFTSNEQNPIVTTSANMSNTGTYTLTATTPNEYSSTISIEVEIHSVPEVAIGGNPTVCEGNTLALIGGIDGLAEYHWTGPNGFVSNLQNPIVSTNASTDMEGNYILTVTNEFGCTASAVSNVEVMPIPHDAEFSLPSCIYIDNNYLFTNLGNNDDSFEYTWDFGDDIISNQASPNHTFLNQGYHCITLTVENQCGITSYSPEYPVFLYPNECACTFPYDFHNNITISGTNEWLGPEITTVKKDIIIEPGATLILFNKTIQFGPEGRIIVKPQGKLFITNSTTLQGLESCNNMWQGVEVWGVHNSDDTYFVQGKIINAKNDNFIKNAHIGVLFGARNMENLCDCNIEQAFLNEFAGGYIEINDNLHLKNNGIGIKVLRKHYSTPSTWGNTGLKNTRFSCEINGLSDINYNSILGFAPYPNCHNKWAGNANFLQITDVGVWMDNVSITQFLNCYFESLQYGILSNGSHFNVLESDFYNSDYGILTYNSDYDVFTSNFKNVNRGIVTHNSDFNVAESKFDNSIHGILAYKSHFDVKTSKFNKAKYGILSYDSYYNVLQSNFTNATFGIRIETINSTLNSGHEISECYFDMIPGQANTPGTAIYIKNGVLDKIHDNNFGTQATPQTYNDVAIHTIGASRFSIRENNFLNFNTGVRVYNSAPDGGFVGAGISSTHDNWYGNIFNQCKTNILTRGNNKNLKLRCNMCYNNSNALYNVNFYSIGFMSNQGYYLSPTSQMSLVGKQRHGAGNEFWGSANHAKKIESTTHSYRYYHQSNDETTPEIPSSITYATILSYNIGVQKSNNPTACPNLFGQISIPIPIPFPYWPQINYLSEQQDLYVQEYENLQLTLDNGKTNELLNDIAGNMPNGRLKNKLIANSPLSDTVITSLLIEYPLSHGNFKNVMQINMPVSQNVEPYLFERLSTIPTGISRQLTPLQAHNPNVRTLTSIKDDMDFWEMEKQLFTNDLLINLTDTINNNIAVAKELLEYENTLSSKQLLYNTYVQELDTTSASNIFNEITLEYPNNDWISLQEIFKSLEEQEKTFYDMDSTQLSFVRELAYKCPADHASFSAQAVLHYLFEEEVPECEIMTTRKKTSLVKDVVFATPEDEAYIEDNFPDPFTGKTTVNYYLPKEMQGKVIVYDMFGRLVEQFILETGEKTLEMNLEQLVPGVYTYSFVVDDKQIDVKKMIITQ